ncbi:hypothetical protein LEM8419_00624 [Neolewinella maritima]|uniref:Uncharacterized protein n=1 Tax=Neolewinella maritima TaxID=1383882 RepID=A0ABM9AYE4_9BACT|nr:hypothetical protein [Neolewinella maritima]CAH0999326.1 hypothetical protein LEM8419_00624 [Neolewinella maritima]
MKRLLLSLLVCLATCPLLLAQGVPQGMQYQAVARDLAAQVLPNTGVELQINLLADGQADRVVYAEHHRVETNALGLFTLTIGQGEALQGTFAEVPWSSSEVWMEIQIMENGRFVTISNSKMLSVPYAFYAATAGDLRSEGELEQKAKNGVPAQAWSLFGNRTSDPTKDKLGTTDCADLIIVTDDVERIRILCSGAVLIDSDLDIGNDLTVQNNAEFNISGGNTIVNGDLSVANGSTTNLTGPLNVDGPTDLNNTLNVDGTTDLNSTVNVNNGSTTNLSGPVNVDGPTDLNNTLNVDGTTDLNSTVNVTNGSTTNLSGPVNVDGATKLNNTLDVAGVTNLNNVLNVNNASTTNLSGALNVTGVTTIGSALNVTNNSASFLTGPLTVNGAGTINNSLDVADCITSGETNEARFRFCPEITNGSVGSFNNYPLQVSGASQGMAIRVNEWAPINNFVAFFADGEMKGRIEGNTGFIVQQFKDTSKDLLEYDPDEAKGSTETAGSDTIAYDQSNEAREAGDENIPENEIPLGSQVNTKEVVDLVILSVKFIVSVIKVATSFASIPFDPVDIFDAAIAAVFAGVDLGVFLGFTITNTGVAYQSGSGDYAEWLIKHDSTEQLQYGEVVGVIGGAVSRTFTEADQFMVVSAAPAVVGAMPPSAEAEALYEKIAFIGQVPVKVRGVVLIGDYLLPSGEGDGLAIAVSKQQMLPLDYARIIGVAWQASDPDRRGEAYQMITCAVGINQNDMAGMIDQMQTVMNGMQDALAKLDPAFEVHAFETTGRTMPPAAGLYSVSPTHQDAVSGYFQDKEYNSREELGQLVVDALEEQADLDLSKYPVVERMLLDPAYAAQAQTHYSELLGTYTDWLEQLERN